MRSIIPHKPGADIQQQDLGIDVGSTKHQPSSDHLSIYVAQKAGAVPAVAKVDLMPPVEIDVVEQKRGTMLKLGQAPEEIGDVQVQDPPVLVHAMRSFAVRLGHGAFLQQRGQARDFKHDPAQLEVECACIGF